MMTTCMLIGKRTRRLLAQIPPISRPSCFRPRTGHLWAMAYLGRRGPGRLRIAARSAVALVLLLGAGSAWAQSASPSVGLNTGINGTPLPAPPVPPGREPVDTNSTMPPFTAPLPPSVPFPPPIVVPPATPPPQYQTPGSPWSATTVPTRPAPAGPRQLAEAPDFARRSAGGLRQALDEYDRRLGLAPGGGVLSAVRDLARSEGVRGGARLQIVVDSTGRILRTDVVDATEDVEGWRRLGDALQEIPIRGMRAEGRHGVWMLVDVSSTVERSSGRSQWWAPGVAVVFDVADIGARNLRVVHANVASQVSF